jgi:purine nucleosidase
MSITAKTPSPVPLRVVVDTDIGTDVDDALALGVLLGCPEVELEAITAAYGDTLLRAGIARRLLAIAGRESIHVRPGDGRPLTDGAEIFWLGHEGEGVPDLDSAMASLPAPDRRALADAVLACRALVDVVAIAPLANVARALDDARFASRVRHVWVMGGDFQQALDEPEHNWRLDPVAAARVLRSGLPMTITGFDQTVRCRLDDAFADALAEAGPLGAVLSGLVRRWWAVTAPAVENFAHDAVAVLSMLHPELFDLREVELRIDDRGLVTARPLPGSPIRIVVDYDVAATRKRILGYLLRAGAAPSVAP